jgi:hypothetical protein
MDYCLLGNLLDTGQQVDVDKVIKNKSIRILSYLITKNYMIFIPLFCSSDITSNLNTCANLSLWTLYTLYKVNKVTISFI